MNESNRPSRGIPQIRPNSVTGLRFALANRATLGNPSEMKSQHGTPLTLSVSCDKVCYQHNKGFPALCCWLNDVTPTLYFLVFSYLQHLGHPWHVHRACYHKGYCEDPLAPCLIIIIIPSRILQRGKNKKHKQIERSRDPTVSQNFKKRRSLTSNPLMTSSLIS